MKQEPKRIGGQFDTIDDVVSGLLTPHDRIIKFSGTIGSAQAELAEAFYLLRKSKGYKAIGFKSFKEYMAQPCMALSFNKAHQLSKVYEFYVEERKQPPDIVRTVPYTKLTMLMPAIRRAEAEGTDTGEAIQYWIDRAAVYSYTDLRQELREAKGDLPKKVTKREIVRAVLDKYGIPTDEEKRDEIALEIVNKLYWTTPAPTAPEEIA